MESPTITLSSIVNRIIDESAQRQGFEISEYYMVGDNPSGDVKGANDMGWTSILVKTGNFGPDIDADDYDAGYESGESSEETSDSDVENDHENPATHVVDRFSDAINLILEKEGIL
jgi:ribonucleotide monophosphatase NagD (HAD superfamily)